MRYMKIATHFSSAHHLEKYPGNCSRLHGHNWKIILIFQINQLDELGMGYDFKELKNKVETVMKYYDHQYLNELDEFKEVNPTAENIAESIFIKINQLKLENIEIYEVEVFESEKYSIIYRR